MLKRNRTVKWIKQKSKVSQKILIRKGMKEGRKLRQTQKLYEKQVKQKRVEVIKKQIQNVYVFIDDIIKQQ